MSADKTIVTRDVRVGESISLDNGRIRLVVEDKSGKLARIRFEMDPDVTFSKVRPGMAEIAKRGIR